MTGLVYSLLSFMTQVLAATSIAVLAICEHTKTFCLMTPVGLAEQVVFTVVNRGDNAGNVDQYAMCFNQ